MTTTATPRALLGATRLFDGLPADVLDVVAGQVIPRHLVSGEYVFRQGDTGDSLYFVVDGALQVERDGVALARRGPGECVGEFALIDAGVRSACVRADGDACVLRWTRDDAWAALAAHDDVRRRVLEMLVAKLRDDVAAQVATAVEREQVQQDLRRAREIQLAMLPDGDLETDRLVVSGVSIAANDVGGDYFDRVATSAGATTVVIADVAGHGLYSALLVAIAKSCFQAEAHLDAPPDAVVAAMNRSIWLSVRTGMLMSCACVRVDTAAGVLRYSNAGHPPLIHLDRTTGALRTLDATDPVLGIEIFRDAQFTAAQVPWRSTDLLVLYSDGITEARNREGEEFGVNRLHEAVARRASASVQALRTGVLDDLERFCGGVPDADDVTLVVVAGR